MLGEKEEKNEKSSLKKILLENCGYKICLVIIYD